MITIEGIILILEKRLVHAFNCKGGRLCDCGMRKMAYDLFKYIEKNKLEIENDNISNK